MMKPDTLDIDILRRDLAARAEALFVEIWGEPQNPRAAKWRPRRSKPGDDPRRMAMRGAERGLWYDSARGHGGDLLDFIAVERLGLATARADFPRVIREAADWLGTNPRPDAKPILRCNETNHRSDANSIEREIAAVIAVATPLAGPALRYWRDVRCLDVPPESSVMRLPAGALKRRKRGSLVPFAEREAVLVLGRDDQDQVRALQRIILAEGGADRDRTLPKFALGPIGQFSPVFEARENDVANGIAVLAEGPETAGAIWSASGARLIVCGGGLSRRIRDLAAGEAAIVAAENDAPGNPARLSRETACAEAIEAGARVAVFDCVGEPGSGFDAADLIRQPDGRDRLRALVKQAAHDLTLRQQRAV